MMRKSLLAGVFAAGLVIGTVAIAQDMPITLWQQSTTCAAGTTTVILTSGSTWTVPDCWNNADNSVEVIGAGGGGSGTLGGGGGGGADPACR